MGYQAGHYYRYCNLSDCVSDIYWFPDGTNTIRNEITSWYMTYYGRYGEQSGVEGHRSSWLASNSDPALRTPVSTIVFNGGVSSGEQQAVNAQGRHCGMSTGSCPPPPSASFSASPSSIILGNSSTLTWSTSGVTSVSINQGIGGRPTSGSTTVSPSTTTVYTLTASGPRGTITRQTTVTVTIPAPTVSFSVSSSSICRGSSATLSWSAANFVNSVSIDQGIGSVATSGTRSVSPTSTTQYTITVNGTGGTVTSSVTLTVFQPTTANLSLDALTIIRGQNTTLRWVTTGDATSATIDQGIGAVNINGNRSISPSETITYTVYVTGICTNSSDSITLTVYQPPTVSITGPVSINYGQQGTLSYEATHADISLKLSPVYNYKNGSLSGSMFDVNLPIGSVSNGQITTQIPYNDFGPFSVTYVIVATGNGGQESKQINISINVDETPSNVLVPQSEDLLKDQAPIFTPDAIVTSYEIVIDDIDIPVEVKSDKPILIDVNSQEDWKPIREL